MYDAFPGTGKAGLAREWTLVSGEAVDYSDFSIGQSDGYQEGRLAGKSNSCDIKGEGEGRGGKGIG